MVFSQIPPVTPVIGFGWLAVLNKTWCFSTVPISTETGSISIGVGHISGYKLGATVFSTL